MNTENKLETLGLHQLGATTGGVWSGSSPQQTFRFDEPGEPKTCDALVAGPTAQMIATPGFCDPAKFGLQDSQEAHFTGPGRPTKQQLMKRFPGVPW